MQIQKRTLMLHETQPKGTFLVLPHSALVNKECYVQWRTQKIFMGGSVIQWLILVICIWCMLFVTSQFEIILIFPNQRFGEFKSHCI